MAEDGRGEKDEAAPAISVRGATAPPRDKPVIEGEAVRRGGSSPDPEKAAAKTPSASPERAPDNALAAPAAEAEAVTKSPEAAESSAASPLRRYTDLWPMAAAVVIGALIAVGGAFGLHYLDQNLDQTGPALAALETRVGTLEQASRNMDALQSGAAVLDKRVAALEQTMQATTAALAQEEAHLRQIDKELQDARKAGAAGAKSLAARDLAPLADKVDTLAKELAALDQRVTAFTTKFTAELHNLQAEKSAAMDSAVSHAEAVARAVLAGNLRHDVEMGLPFGADLAALENRGIAKEKLAALAPFAASGVVTQAALAQQFAALTPALLAAAPEPKAKGFFARLAQDAAHLVRIRKIGDAKGDDLAAHAARIAAALAAGRLDEAWHGWQDLPDTAKAKSQAFGTALQQHIAAVDAAKAIEAEALAMLAKVKS